MPVVLDTDDLQRNDVAILEDFLWVTDPSLNDLGDVDQTLDGPGQSGECTEGDQLSDHTGNDVAHSVLGDHLLPLLRCCAPDGEGDLLVLLIDPEYVDVHLVANLKQLFRLRVTVPRQLGEVNEAIGPTEVNEHTEVPDGRDFTGTNLAFCEFLQ